VKKSGNGNEENSRRSMHAVAAALEEYWKEKKKKKHTYTHEHASILTFVAFFRRLKWRKEKGRGVRRFEEKEKTTTWGEKRRMKKKNNERTLGWGCTSIHTHTHTTNSAAGGRGLGDVLGREGRGFNLPSFFFPGLVWFGLGCAVSTLL